MTTETFLTPCSVFSGQRLYNSVNDSTTNSISVVNIGNNRVVQNKLPDYRQKIASHTAATNAYIRTEHNLKQLLLYSSSVRKPQYSKNVSEEIHWVNPFSSGYTFSPATVQQCINADDIALKRLKSRLANDLEQFKALVPLAEIKETYHLYGQVVEATEGLLRSLLWIKHGHPREAFRAASNAWLTFSFGLSPTISDLNALYDSMNSYIQRADVTRRFTGKSEATWKSVDNNASSTTACEGHTWKWKNAQYDHMYQVRYTAGVRFKLRSANNYGLQEHFGLEFGELPSTAWELIPFSWVVDYFTTTGDYLSDLFTSNAGDTIYCCKSYKYLRMGLNDVYLENTNPGVNITTCERFHYPHEHRFFQFERVPLSQLPHRAFRFKTSAEIGVNSVNRLLNLASLLLA